MFFESLPLDLVIATPSSAAAGSPPTGSHSPPAAGQAVRPDHRRRAGNRGHSAGPVEYMCSRRINN